LKLIAKLAAGVASAAILTGAATSASASVTGNYHGAGIEISPTRIEIHLNAKRTATQVFTIENPGSNAAVVAVGVAAFHQVASGKLSLSAPDLPGSVTGLSWVHASASSMKLQPGQVRKVVVRITEPASASPGQRYVAVLFTSSPVGHVEGQVATRISVAGELLIDTPGALRNTASYSLSAPSISWGGPVTLGATVKATGNTYVYVHNASALAGGQKVRLPDVVALAGSTRTVTTVWEHPGIGIDHVSWQGETKTIIVLPGQILLILLGLIMLTSGGLIWRRSLRRHARSRKHSRRAATA
jgi:hypothetical protein